jgi:hypothetical protein
VGVLIRYFPIFLIFGKGVNGTLSPLKGNSYWGNSFRGRGKGKNLGNPRRRKGNCSFSPSFFERGDNGVKYGEKIQKGEEKWE